MAAPPDAPRRRMLSGGKLALAVAVVGAALLATAVVLLSGGGPSDTREQAHPLVPRTRAESGSFGPLRYDRGHNATFEQRAAAGFAHPLYAKPAGGAQAAANRTARWRPRIERAAQRAGVDADTLEALVYLESAGDPNAMAGPDPR